MSPNRNDLLKRFSEEEDIFGDAEGIDYNNVETLRTNMIPQALHILLPLFALTGNSSGQERRITRETLSEYSEENETDLTSELSDHDFDWGELNKNGNVFQQMNQRLIATKVAQKKEAEREQREFAQRRREYDPNQTLKLKDFNKLTNENLTILDQLDNEKTVNYEYTRDDYDDFEDGFAKNFEAKLRVQPSMPTLRQNPPKLKKYNSYAEFKCDNRVRLKLERIPSFYNKPSPSFNNKDQVLNKYKENKTYHPHHKKMGTVKCLNNDTEVTLAYPTNNSMKYNQKKNRWEGNEIDLIRFEKPSLIPHSVTKPSTKEGNMIYDPEKLQWINTEEEEDDNIFDDIPDLVEQKLQSPLRGASQFTQRTMSTATISREQSSRAFPEFGLSSKTIEKFRKEELMVERKINHWFIGSTGEFNRDYYWEIRNMVMDK
ncbi:Mitotic check point protein BFA1 [Candida viswanathii]|uniref:Mitotic check point protein BFA1 n=1 Tax=Candida viswanathii TaxID=5486 RepID=A0A367XRU4_9ASCO|nr:Mitotic check point protein BFA1 [Candida viswanathii]